MKLSFALLLVTVSASFNGLYFTGFKNLNSVKEAIDQQFLGVSAENPEIHIGSALQFMENLNNDVQEVFGQFFPGEIVLDTNLHQDIPWDTYPDIDKRYKCRAAVYLAALQLDRLSKNPEYVNLIKDQSFRTRVTEKLMVKFFERVFPHAHSNDLKPDWFEAGKKPSVLATTKFDMYLNQPRSCSALGLYNAFLEYETDVGCEINNVIIEMIDEGSTLVSESLRDLFLNIQGAMTKLHQYASKDSKQDVIAMLNQATSVTHTLDQGGNRIKTVATSIKKKLAAAKGVTITEPEPTPVPLTHDPIHPPTPTPTGGTTLIPTGILGDDGFETFITFPDHETPAPIPTPATHTTLIPTGKIGPDGFQEFIAVDSSLIDTSVTDTILIDPSLPPFSTSTSHVDDDLLEMTDEHGNPLIYNTPTTTITSPPVTPTAPLIVSPPVVVPPITSSADTSIVTPGQTNTPADGTPIQTPGPTTPKTLVVIPPNDPISPTTPVVPKPDPKPSRPPVVKPPTPETPSSIDDSASPAGTSPKSGDKVEEDNDEEVQHKVEEEDNDESLSIKEQSKGKKPSPTSSLKAPATAHTSVLGPIMIVLVVFCIIGGVVLAVFLYMRKRQAQEPQALFN